MKIEAKILADFIKKVTLSGKIPSMILKFSKEGLSSKVMDTSTIVLTEGLLLPKYIKDLEVINIPVKNTGILLNFLRGFEGEVELKINLNKFSLFNSKKQVDLIMPAEEFIENDLKIELKAVFDEGMNIKTEILRNVSESMNVLKSSSMHLKVENKTLNVSTGEEGFDSISEKVPVSFNKDAKAEYGVLTKDVVSVLDDNINISFKKDYPIQIKESLEKMHMRYIIAPLAVKGDSE